MGVHNLLAIHETNFLYPAIKWHDSNGASTMTTKNDSQPCEDKLEDVDDILEANEQQADFDAEETNAKETE